MAGSTVVKSGISGQIACRLCLNRFFTSVFDCFDKPESIEASNSDQFNSEVLRAAFKGANKGVYEYSHKLAATGQMLATLFGVVVQDGMVTSGRVGAWSGYLVRAGRIFPFFENPADERSAHFGESLVGAQPKITVETASWPLEGGDQLIVFSRQLSPEHEIALGEECAQGNLGSCAELAEALFFVGEEPAVGFMAAFGPEAVYLKPQEKSYGAV